MKKTLITAVVLIAASCSNPPADAPANTTGAKPGLWQIYDQSLKSAKYVDLTHTLTPTIPVWKGFGPSRFAAASDPQSGKSYTYAKDGFEATRYELSTDQFGTQLDPPAHWAPEFPAI